MVAKGGFTKGPSHAEGGIPMTVKSTGQKIEVEGGEGIINKRSMADDRVFEVKGTPKQIASAINEIDGNGVSFDKGAEITMFESGGMLYEPYVSDKYVKNRNRYDLYADAGDDFQKIGEAKIKPQPKHRSSIEIDKLNIDEGFRSPEVYTYFTRAIIDKSKKRGAVVNIECIDDSCISEMIDLGSLNEDCDKLYIK